MSHSGIKHKNYEILNLIGYGLAKFNDAFIREFGCDTKTSFYKFCLENGIADTVGTISNRQDLFDPFFPENGRRGWWQKGDAYIHRKIFIDNQLFTITKESKRSQKMLTVLTVNQRVAGSSPA